MAKYDPAHVATDAEIAKIEKRIAKEYKKAHKEVSKKLDDYLAAFAYKDDKWQDWVAEGKKTAAEYAEWKKGQVLIGKRWEEMRDSLAQDYTNAAKIAQSIAKEHAPEVYALNHNYGTFEVEKKAMVDTSYTLYNKAAVERMYRENPKLYPKYGKAISKQIKEGKQKAWDKRRIQSVLMQGIVQGESIPNLTKRLEHVTGGDHKAAIRNARTMMTGVQNAGRLDSFERAKKLGIPVRKQWLATLDARTRHWHRELDGKIVDCDKPFENDFGKIMFPGDPTADAANVYNCRCTMMAAIKGFELDTSDTSLRHDAHLGEMSYDEWKATKKSISNPITLPEEKAAAIKGAWNKVYSGKNGNVENTEHKHKSAEGKTIVDEYMAEEEKKQKKVAKKQKKKEREIDYSEVGGKAIYDELKKYDDLNDLLKKTTFSEFDKIDDMLKKANIDTSPSGYDALFDKLNKIKGATKASAKPDVDELKKKLKNIDGKQHDLNVFYYIIDDSSILDANGMLKMSKVDDAVAKDLEIIKKKFKDDALLKDELGVIDDVLADYKEKQKLEKSLGIKKTAAKPVKNVDIDYDEFGGKESYEILKKYSTKSDFLYNVSDEEFIKVTDALQNIFGKPPKGEDFDEIFKKLKNVGKTADDYSHYGSKKVFDILEAHKDDLWGLENIDIFDLEDVKDELTKAGIWKIGEKPLHDVLEDLIEDIKAGKGIPKKTVPKPKQAKTKSETGKKLKSNAKTKAAAEKEIKKFEDALEKLDEKSWPIKYDGVKPSTYIKNKDLVKSKNIYYQGKYDEAVSKGDTAAIEKYKKNLEYVAEFEKYGKEYEEIYEELQKAKATVKKIEDEKKAKAKAKLDAKIEAKKKQVDAVGEKKYDLGIAGIWDDNYEQKKISEITKDDVKKIKKYKKDNWFLGEDDHDIQKVNQVLADLKEYKKQKAALDKLEGGTGKIFKNPDKQKTIANAKTFDYDYHEHNTFDWGIWNGLEERERHGLQRYTGSSYTSMNEIMRGQRNPDAHNVELINGAIDAISHFKLKEDTDLWRGMGSMRSLARAMKMDIDDVERMLEDGSIVGQPFTEDGFGSTAARKEKAWHKEIMLHIHCPKGTEAMYVDLVSLNSGEREILLQNGTRMEILNAEKQGGRWWLECVILEQKPKVFKA